MAFWNNPSALLPKQSHRWVISLGEHTGQSPSNQPGDTIPHYFAKSVDRPSYKIDTIQAKYLYAHTFNFPKRVTWNPIKIEFYDVLIQESGSDNQFSNFVREPKIFNTDPKIVVTNYDNDPEENDLRIRRALDENSLLREGGGRLEEKYVKKNALTINPPLNKSYQKSTQLFFYQFLQKCGYFDPNELEREDQLLRFRSYHFKKNMIGAITGQNVDLLNNNSSQYRQDFIVIEELDGDGNVVEYWKIYNPIITDISTGKLDYSSDNILTITVGMSYDWAELVPTTGKFKPYNKPTIEQGEEESNRTKSWNYNKPEIIDPWISGEVLEGRVEIKNTQIVQKQESFSVDENGKRIPGTTVPGYTIRK